MTIKIPSKLPGKRQTLRNKKIKKTKEIPWIPWLKITSELIEKYI